MFNSEDYFVSYGDVNIHEICRLCRNSKGVMSHIFSSIGIDTTEPLSNRIMSFVNIDMREGDGLPNLICHRCLYHVEKLNKFKIKCEQSDALLRQYISYQMEEDCKNIFSDKQLTTPTDNEFNGLINEECDIKHEPLVPIMAKEELNTEAAVENVVMVVDPSTNTVDASDEQDSESTASEINCPHCNKQLETKEQYDRHVQIHSQDGPFPCDYCEVIEKDKAALKLHWRKEHSGNRAHMCQACGESFYRREDLIEHNIRHDKIKPFPCKEPSCNKAFAYRSDLRKHLVIHTGARPYVCTICRKSFTRSTNLNKHYRLHSGRKPFACSECDKLFASRGDLARHLVIHTGEKPYSCSICMLSFNRKDKLLRHEKLHKGERPHTCYECPTSFHRKEELTKHIQFHHYSPIMQMEDGTLALARPNSNNQNDEIKVEPGGGGIDKTLTENESESVVISVDPSHWDGASHPCDICNKVFSQASELLRHKFKHGKSKDFICEVCSKGFYTRRELTRHSHIHSNIRPYVCEICGKSFSRKDKLTRHMKIHASSLEYTTAYDYTTSLEYATSSAAAFAAVTVAGNFGNSSRSISAPPDPPICNICNKTLSSHHELTRHLYIHTGDKPFKCDQCTSSYCRKDKLVKHVKKAHPELTNFDNKAPEQYDSSTLNVVLVESNDNIDNTFA